MLCRWKILLQLAPFCFILHVRTHLCCELLFTFVNDWCHTSLLWLWWHCCIVGLHEFSFHRLSDVAVFYPATISLTLLGKVVSWLVINRQAGWPPCGDTAMRVNRQVYNLFPSDRTYGSCCRGLFEVTMAHYPWSRAKICCDLEQCSQSTKWKAVPSP